jgi:hypothetical protein
MAEAPVSKMQRTRTASEAVRVPLLILLPLLATGLLLLSFAPGASALKVISESGKGAGQTRGPKGVAVDFETGRLFVADTKNNRIDIFDKDGNFEKAFGFDVNPAGGTGFEFCTTNCKEGIAGEGKGQFSGPTKIAVDDDPGSPSHHAIYVVDQGNQRIQKFDEGGNFVLDFGSSGAGEGKFAGAMFVGVGPAGIIYVVDNPKPGSEFETRLQKFEPTGTVIAPQHVLPPDGKPAGAQALAVDSSGDFYVSNGAVNRKYEANGNLIGEISQPFEEATGVLALAVDDEDHLFTASSLSASSAKVSIIEFDPAGNRIRRFGYGSFRSFTSAIAPAPKGGGIYASEEQTDFDRVLHLDFPAKGPLVFPEACKADPPGNTKATLFAEVNPEGKATTYHFQYITEEDFLANGGSFSGAHPATSSPESASIGSDFILRKASAEVNVVPETEYRCRVVAKNADAPAGNEGPEGSFTALDPLEIGSTWSSGVGTEEATLNAEVNPLGIPTTGYFQYVDEATYQRDVAELGEGHGFDHASKAPEGEPIDFGAGNAFKAGSATIGALKPGTAYRYRILASDPLIAPKEIAGPTKALRTYASIVSLPDERAYELVSPGKKNSAEVAVPEVSAGLFALERSVRIQAASGSGEALTYTSWTSFGQAEGAPSSSQYLSKRSPSGWGTENVSPFGFLIEPLEVPYRGFTPDLGFGAFILSEPPLTPEADGGSENLYLRDNATGKLQALTIEAPQLGEGEGFCTGYAGASEDGTHAIFAARGAMAGAPTGKGFSLYEWSVAAGLALVSVLPDGTPAPPVKTGGEVGTGTGFGAVGGNCTMGQAIVRNAISADGSTLFWTYGGEYNGAKQPLFARIDGTETVQLDAKAGGKGPAGQGKFWAATADGSKALFIAPGKLTADAKGEGQLYRYDTEARSLTDLTPGAKAPEIRGVVGASEDGAYVYFVAKAALTGEEVGAAGQKAQEGASNLYLYHEGEGLRFIARLSGLDARDWSSAPSGQNGQSARVSPDGRHLALLSVEAEALSGYDNRIFPGTHCQPEIENKLAGDPHCAEAYLYDAEADELACASCNPAGSRPTGPTELPAWTNPYEGPRFLADDGSRLFFESRDALSAEDENGRRDVYQFERVGSGSCDSKSPDLDPASGGCLSLISSASGKGEDETYLIDASADGRDVFFSTRRPLVGWDQNENYDVYDARAGGGFPEPPQPPPICEGEGCKAPVTTPPSGGSSPATAGFQGPGNAVQKPKKKKKHRHKAKRHGHHKAQRMGRSAR